MPPSSSPRRQGRKAADHPISDGAADAPFTFAEAVAVRTLRTTHLAPNPVVTEFLKRVYAETADLMAAAGLPVKLQFGESLWWFFSETSLAIAAVGATDPIRVTTTQPHGFSTGDTVIVAGVISPTGASGTHVVTVVSSTSFDLVGANGAGEAVTLAADARVAGGSMAFYDPDTSAAAVTALGRPLVKFTCQDSDPTVNAGADADFLRDRLAANIDAIVAHIQSIHPTAVFELLYPFDVLHPVTYHAPHRPYPQGGRLNHHVSTPTAGSRSRR